MTPRCKVQHTVILRSPQVVTSVSYLRCAIRRKSLLLTTHIFTGLGMRLFRN